MAGINLKRFVDINIKQHTTSILSGTRDTIALFTNEGTANTTVTVTSYTDASTQLTGMTNTLAFLSVYFEHGGVNAKIIEGVAIANLTNDMISELDNENIIVGYVSTSENREQVYAALKSIATTRANDSSVYGINEKIIVANTFVTTDSDTVKNFAVKYSDVQGAEMTIAAYLSQIDAHGTDTVYDYAFTQEQITAASITDTVFETLMTNNMNVDIYLANSVRNCGGNCKDGSDIVNTFVRIVLHQTLTDRLIELLSQKLKSNTGISKIYASITEELNRYLSCGYLTTDKIWSDNDLVVSVNGQSYTIIEKGTALQNGYVVRVLPFSSLSDEDKAEHKAPNVYVIIADQYGIRKITIQGEII